jgi:holo-[acyl-carrier protein] synthase
MFRLNPGDAGLARPPLGMRLGFDLVQISQVADSIERFGDAYRQRLFTPGELDYAQRGHGVAAERLAARLAAKEAVIKALALSEAGVGWREIEVRKLPEGDCDIVLHGRTAELAAGMGVARILLSLSHDGDYAGAFISVLFNQARCDDRVEAVE